MAYLFWGANAGRYAVRTLRLLLFRNHSRSESLTARSSNGETQAGSAPVPVFRPLPAER